MRNTIRAAALVLLLSPCGAWSAQKHAYTLYTPPSGSFTVEIPEGWVPFEAETPRGVATHIIGPSEADGAWRASYHVHYFQKGKPGYVAPREAMKAFRERDKDTDRDVDQITVWRVDQQAAKMFQVREKRMLPSSRLPSEIVSLHHFYMFIPSGRDEYYMIKLSTTEKTFLDYRAEFRRFMKSFRSR
ncbi:MAG: hypothetical protein AUJ52_00120 [Elusimicrobia bacterium CG1_02_63_36]|nr:MAG: hypothetical protein AUJ52_00120 [Elusimicrobia bacterium CG1_02_63_36]PIP82689.1 MAG: hypothetical protein COR54_13590 [Elusimicrobia bacterium CG22_combo_CG10-13_8_21_14_all_63_91]PJA14114.1 MAG: hypothetical protein COX66_13440 [Elusimicrobia bacterium CG_4_10_14_0_2_um_filter_63_34]PJB27070.1 MAG: hypothetical protein CO113_00390 [Elusimicrobia bacterium CG_4_9_14_3_um_filter_62_55]